MERKKMSKSGGNAIGVDEAVYGVCEVDRGYEFRSEDGRVLNMVDVKRLGVWRDRAGSGDYFTASRFGGRPVFLHQVGNPEPCQFDVDGEIRDQHPIVPA